MEKRILLFCLVLLFAMATGARAQEEAGDGKKEEKEKQVDLLKSPASPAAHLLNFATSSIDRPTDLTAVWLTANNLTGNFTKLPNSYAIDISPAILFKKGNLSLKNLQCTTFKEVSSQTFVISAGFKTFEDTMTGLSYYKTAIGFKFMLARPDWTSNTYARYNELTALQRKITASNKRISDSVERHPEMRKLEAERSSIVRKYIDQGIDYTIAKDFQDISALKNETRKILLDQLVAEENAWLEKQIADKAKDFSIERKGWFAEVAGGFSAAFPTNELNYSVADKGGAWLTAGYESGNDNVTSLFIARYLYQPEKIFADVTGTIPTKRISTFDVGARFIYTSGDGKFTVSGESIYRSVLSSSIIKPSWRVVMNAAYAVSANNQLTFTFGRDFDGVVEKGGNLVAGINYLIGLGGKRIL